MSTFSSVSVSASRAMPILPQFVIYARWIDCIKLNDIAVECVCGKIGCFCNPYKKPHNDKN